MSETTRTKIETEVKEVTDKILREAIKWMRETEIKVPTNSYTLDKFRQDVKDNLDMAKDRDTNKAWKKSYRQGYIDAYEDIQYYLNQL